MRTQVLLILSAPFLVAIVFATAPHMNVTLNEAGTDVIAIDLFGVAEPKQAVTAERR